MAKFPDPPNGVPKPPLPAQSAAPRHSMLEGETARVSAVYVTALGRGLGGVRVSQAYLTVLGADSAPTAPPKIRVSQSYVSVLGRGLGGVRVSQLYVSLLVKKIKKKEKVSMGAVADLIAAPKTFAADSELARYLENKVTVVDPATPAAYAEKDEVQSIAIYSGTVDGGTFTLTITLRDGTTFTTAGIAFDANAATIEAAIDTASPAAVGDGDISVSGGPLTTTPVVLTFDGASVDGTNQGLTTIDGASLTGGGSAGAVSVTTSGQTARPARAVLYNLGVLADATPPAQGLTTVPTAGDNLQMVPPWVVRELAQEIAFEDGDNAVYQAIVTGLLGYTDSAPLVTD